MITEIIACKSKVMTPVGPAIVLAAMLEEAGVRYQIGYWSEGYWKEYWVASEAIEAHEETVYLSVLGMKLG